MQRIISLNFNGIRSAAKKGCFEWLATQKADFLCVQELKAQQADMTADFLAPGKLKGHFHYAEKKGYSGAGVYARQQPRKVVIGFGSKEFDAEGRYVQCDFADLSVISVYKPSGSSGEDRQAAKFRFLELFLPHLIKLRKSGREIVICGDFNIAHKEIDLKNWKSNQKNSGFLPEERAWLTQVFDEVEPMLFVQMHNNFCVTVRSKLMTSSQKVCTEFQIVVDLTVEDNLHAAIFVAQRLSTPGDINNAESSMSQRHTWLGG